MAKPIRQVEPVNVEGRTLACRSGNCWACPSTSDEWSTCACDCHGRTDSGAS